MRPLYVWVALALASVLPFLYMYTLVNRARFASRFAARFALANMIRRYLGASAEISILILTSSLW